MNDASSSIIEVLKGQLESGKLKDLVKYFQFSAIYDNPLINSAVNKFANKLNNFYNISMAEAMKIADKLNPAGYAPIDGRIKRRGEQRLFALSSILTKISGNVTDMGLLLNQMRIA
jgi:hypothetical protein